ncbi:flavin reductase family protein [Phycisphaerales bacterium AB-hyl4]|uniref:Flavin reductase family protein n=1 Tax=Natronomicrosphaera hydrolytica TaxID=3242702 RepID=A0ABV4U7R9_9BACT
MPSPAQPKDIEKSKARQLGIAEALGRIPSGLFVLTAQHEDRRQGMLTSLVQQVCFEPPMVCVSVAKGRPIMPLISESRQFALCQLSENDKLLLRKFAGGVDPSDDPFLGFDLVNTHLHNLPVLKHALAYLECELACHLDVEGDHDLFVGRVHAGARLKKDDTPHIHLRENGLKY